MILFNTTFMVDDGVHDDFIRWVKADHLPACEELSLLDGQKFFKLLDSDEPGATTYCIQYFIDSDLNYENFIKDVDSATKLHLSKRQDNTAI